MSSIIESRQSYENKMEGQLMLIVSIVAAILAGITLRILYERGSVPATVLVFLLSLAGGASARLDGWPGAMGQGVMISVFTLTAWLGVDAQIKGRGYGQVRPRR